MPSILIYAIPCIYWRNPTFIDVETSNLRSFHHNRRPPPLYLCATTTVKPHRYIKSYYRKGAAFLALGKYKDALKNFKQVLKMYPKEKDAIRKVRTPLTTHVISLNICLYWCGSRHRYVRRILSDERVRKADPRSRVLESHRERTIQTPFWDHGLERDGGDTLTTRELRHCWVIIAQCALSTPT